MNFMFFRRDILKIYENSKENTRHEIRLKVKFVKCRHVKRYLQTQLVKSIFVGILKKFQYILPGIFSISRHFLRTIVLLNCIYVKSYVVFPSNIFNLFVPNAPLLYPLKTSENLAVF